MAFFVISAEPWYVCSCGEHYPLGTDMAKKLMNHQFRATPCTSEIVYVVSTWQEDPLHAMLPVVERGDR